MSILWVLAGIISLSLNGCFSFPYYPLKVVPLPSRDFLRSYLVKIYVSDIKDDTLTSGLPLKEKVTL